MELLSKFKKPERLDGIFYLMKAEGVPNYYGSTNELEPDFLKYTQFAMNKNRDSDKNYGGISLDKRLGFRKLINAGMTIIIILSGITASFALMAESVLIDDGFHNGDGLLNIRRGNQTELALLSEDECREFKDIVLAIRDEVMDGVKKVQPGIRTYQVSNAKYMAFIDQFHVRQCQGCGRKCNMGYFRTCGSCYLKGLGYIICAICETPSNRRYRTADSKLICPSCHQRSLPVILTCANFEKDIRGLTCHGNKAKILKGGLCDPCYERTYYTSLEASKTCANFDKDVGWLTCHGNKAKILKAGLCDPCHRRSLPTILTCANFDKDVGGLTCHGNKAKILTTGLCE